MSDRSANEPSFGSDSFLDIVCNLVGIMIILIIVAGLRVGRAPVRPPESEPAPPAPVERSELVDARPDVPHTGVGLGSLAEALELAPDRPQPPVVAEPPPTELMVRAEELQQRMTRSSEQIRELKSQLEATRQRRSEVEELLRGADERSRVALEEAARAESDADTAEAALESLEQQRVELEADVAAALAESPKPRAIGHRVTPVSRQVSEQDEVHFRLAEGRVSVVPMEALAQALKLRIERNRDLFLRLDRYEGTAGPIEGYTMLYAVERQTPSAIEELRNGGPFLRIRLAYYELQAGPDVPSESAEEALTPGSRFLRAVHGARPGTTLTFWIYPDSFALHRRLQEYAHGAGFDVAARPLPNGVPIAGSPHGSRSVAQ